MDEQTAVQVGVGAYLLLTLVIGVLAGENVEDGEDFMVAGRSMPGWLVTFTLFATWFGGGTCLGAAGKVYKQGVSGMIIDPLGAALCLVISAMFFFGRLRRYGFITVCDLYRARYGRATELVTSLCMIPAYVGWVASQIVAFAFVLHTITPLETPTAIVVGTVIVLVYTALGGMWAVAITDFFQGLVLILGLLILLPVVWSEAGGLGEAWAVTAPGHKVFMPTGGALEWVWFLHAWIVIGLGDLPSQGLMSRAMSAEDDRTACSSGYAAALLYVSVGLIPITLGLLGASLIPELDDPEHVLLQLADRYLSPAMMAVFSGALISALMSSADSALLALSSVIVENVIKPLKGDELSPEDSLWHCRLWVVVSAGLAMFVALKFQSVFALMVAASGVGLAALTASFVAALYWPRANGPGALASVILGMATWVGLELAWSGSSAPQATPPADLIGGAVSLVALVVVSMVTGSRHPPFPLKPLTERSSGDSG